MKIAKRFRWEAAHRLPWHAGDCRHLHGHSYRMMVEVEGTPDDRGMLLDFKHLKRVLQPLVDRMDHATLVAEDDGDLRTALEALESKRVVLPGDSTAENVAAFVADHLLEEAADVLAAHSVTSVRVQVWETETCYAETARRVPVAAAAPEEAPAAASAAASGRAS
jgi:6-pyruvoyltetrahydropterin/6-carboxytetrahydropterin synthase